MWKSTIGIVLIGVLLGTVSAEGLKSASSESAFGGFYYRDLRPVAKRNATHVRFSYRLEGSADIRSTTFKLPALRRISWRPDLDLVRFVAVQPLDEDGKGVGAPAQASGMNLCVTGVFARTVEVSGVTLNRRNWFSVYSKSEEPAIGGAPTGFEDFYYTDHSGEVEEVKWRLYKSDNADPPVYTEVGDGVTVYNASRSGSEPLFQHHRIHHIFDTVKPEDVAKIEIETFRMGNVLIKKDEFFNLPGMLWRQTWFETVPGVPNPVTVLVHGVP